MEEEINLKGGLPPKKSIIRLSIIGLLLVSGIAIYTSQTKEIEQQKIIPAVSNPENLAVTALGRIEPFGEVIKLSPPPTQGGAKVVQLLVKEGDRVKADSIVAILDNYDRKLAAVEIAKQEVEVARADLAIVKAGAKQGEINAQLATIKRLQAQVETETLVQLATIDRLKAELANAQVDFKRNQKLAAEGAISASNLDRFRLNLATAKQRVREAEANLKRINNTLDRQIQEARANLDRISEVRGVDVQKARAELGKAIASLAEARAELEQAYVKAPIEGQILKVNAYPGEQVSQEDGVVELGQTEQMMVIAEVYESDISKIKIGQKATIKSEGGAFENTLQGTVNQIGFKIGKQDVLDTDPAADVDVRVVEVKILLDPESSRRVSALTYAKVLANINIE